MDEFLQELIYSVGDSLIVCVWEPCFVNFIKLFSDQELFELGGPEIFCRHKMNGRYA